MALREYQCVRCGNAQLVFDGEEHKLRLGGNCGKVTRQCCEVRKMPPSPAVVHTTDTWMSDPTLDSYPSTYELDRQLNIEAREEAEMKMVQARKDL